MQNADAQPAGSGADGRRFALAGGIGLVALIVLFWWSQLLGGEGTKALDAFEYHYPSYLWFYGEVADGHLPLWNPYQLCGVPTFDTLQTGVVYPPHLLYLLLSVATAMATLGLLHLLLIGLSTYVFCLRAGFGWISGIPAALLVATRGAQPGHITNPSMQEAGAWLAVGFIGVLEVVRGRPLRGGLWIAAATGMSLLAGFPQLSVYAAYAWAFVAIGLTLGAPRSWRRPTIATASVVVGVALGAMLAAIVLLPAIELSAIGGRVRGTLPLSLMLPFGNAGFETPLSALRSALNSRPALPGVAWTFGVVGLALIPLIAISKNKRRIGLVMWSLAALSLVFALGPGTPFFDTLLLLPELGTFRNPWRVLFLADFAIAIAAAAGLHALLSRVIEAGQGEFRARRIAAAIAAAVVAAVVVESFVAPGNGKRLPYDAGHPLLAMYHEPRPVLRALARRPDRVFTIFAGDMNDVSEKLASVFHVRSISDYEILTLRRQREYFTWLYWGALEPTAVNARGYSQRIFYGSYSLLAPGIDPAGVVARSRLLELAAARYVVVPRTAIGAAPVTVYLRDKQLRPVDVRDRQFIVFEQPRALPRAYVSHAVAEAPQTAELLATISRSEFDPRRLSYIESNGGVLPQLDAGSGGDRVEIVEDGLESVTLRARLDGSGLVVLADTYHPGWTAQVDGEPARILATNHLFRGVVVPAGEHEIRFVYRPKSVRLGAALSAAGLLALAGGAWWLRGHGDPSFS